MYRFIYYCAFKYNFKLERTDLLNWTEVLCTNAPSNALLFTHSLCKFCLTQELMLYCPKWKEMSPLQYVLF